MNKIGKIVGCLLLLVPVGVVGQKPQKVSDHLKTIEVNYVGVDELRTLQYKHDGQDFVSKNGNNRYTRALYGSPTEDRIETSDRPVFVAYKAKDALTKKLKETEMLDNYNNVEIPLTYS